MRYVLVVDQAQHDMRVVFALDEADINMLAPPVWVVCNVQYLLCSQAVWRKVERVKVELDLLHDSLVSLFFQVSSHKGLFFFFTDPK